MEKIEVKELKEEDYGEIMKIRKPGEIYNGFDYLPDYYPVLIKSPDYKAFGAFVDNTLVAFVFAISADDGKTLITRAGRVSKEFEGKHAMSTLHHYTEAQLPSYVQRHAFVFSNVVISPRKAIDDGKAKIIFTKVLHIYRTRQEIIMKQIENVVTPANIKLFKKEDLVKLIDSKEVCRQLFPEDHIFVDHMPYRLHKSNIPHIMLHRCIIVGTNVNDPNCNANQRLLTFGNYVVCHSGLLYNLDVYGQNVKELTNHLLIHLGRLRSMTNTNVQLEIICNENMNKDICDEVMKQFGFRRIRFFRTHLYCAESPYTDLMHSNINSKNIEGNTKAKL